jgi:peptide-methionine (R)-S-oxide reductase
MDGKRADEVRVWTRRGFVTVAGAAAAAVMLRLRKGAAPVEAKSAEPKEVTIVEFSDAGQRGKTVTLEMVVKTDDAWRQQLGAEAYEVTRQAGTERPYTGVYWNNHEKGLYRCVCCGTALFSSETKFESGTGWPSFWAPLAKENVHEVNDDSLGMERTEVRCRLCEGHLGHVFDDGPQPTGLRYCMNSVSLRFVKFG